MRRQSILALTMVVALAVAPSSLAEQVFLSRRARRKEGLLGESEGRWSEPMQRIRRVRLTGLTNVKCASIKCGGEEA